VSVAGKDVEKFFLCSGVSSSTGDSFINIINEVGIGKRKEKMLLFNAEN